MLGDEAALEAEEESFAEEGFTDGVLDDEGAVVSDQPQDEKEPDDGQDEQDEDEE